MEEKIIVHIGFSKTGTTTLQKHVFKKHSQVKYLGKPFEFEDETFKTHIHHLMMQESIEYTPEPLKRYIVENRVRETSGSQRVTVLSDEMFLSYSKTRDKGMIAHRIKEVFSPCKIIITIRDQFELLKSAYLSRGRLLVGVPNRFDGLGVSFEEWLNLSYENYERGYIHHADYYKTIDYYAALFGKENVCVLLLEEFIHDRETYVRKLTDFLGIDLKEAIEWAQGAHEHRDISRSELDLELLRTRFFPFHHNFLVKKMSKLAVTLKHKIGKNSTSSVEIPVQWIERLKEEYRDGNRRLMEDFRLPLGKYHYPGVEM